MSCVVAVDIGGTFTDLVAYELDSGSVLYSKAPTTYDNFVAGIMECLDKAAVDPGTAKIVNHGTTLVINALIQRRGANTALVTTEGFRDALEIARGNRPDPFDLKYRRDDPLIPRELRFEVPERIAGDGSVVRPLDTGALDALAARFRDMGVESVAVSFVNAYANAAHEEQAVARLRDALPDVYVAGGTELSREWYEYERTSTVACSAYVGPQVSRYVTRLDKELKDRAFAGSLYMMGSNGGVLSAERSCRQPIALVESGPIGGCIGAAAYARELGFGNVIAFDMGGTTAKSALVEDGQFSVDSIYYVNGYVKGFPIKSPVIDIVEVGSGGGSIAWLDDRKRLHVGPRSAGSTPGPVCYGRGGTEATVTDANLVLGRVDPGHFLGGELRLDLDAARTSIRETLADPLGYDGEDGLIRMADGIVAIAIVTMGGVIKRITIEHGRDPRDFVLFAYGGGGPLHAAILARELSIPTVVIPPEPGNFSATGMLLADARLDDARTFVEILGDDCMGAYRDTLAEMEADGRETLKREIGVSDVTFEHFAEMRYHGQRHNIKVRLTGLNDAAAIRKVFEEDYRRRYGHADAEAPVEFQNLQVSAFAPFERPEVARLPRADGADAAPPASRKVYFAEAGGMVDTKIYDRYALAPGFAADGPAIIQEYGSTTVVGPRDRFEIGALREIRIDCARG